MRHYAFDDPFAPKRVFYPHQPTPLVSARFPERVNKLSGKLLTWRWVPGWILRVWQETNHFLIDRARSANAKGQPLLYGYLGKWDYDNYILLRGDMMSKHLESLVAKLSKVEFSTRVEDKDAAKRWPTLFEFLTTLEEGEDQRATGTINIFAQDGVFKAWLNYRRSGHTACTSFPSLGGLLDHLEAVLCDQRTDWRKERTQRRKR